jgi:hypothetical protein
MAATAFSAWTRGQSDEHTRSQNQSAAREGRPCPRDRRTSGVFHSASTVARQSLDTGGSSDPLRGATEPHSHAFDSQADAPAGRSGFAQPQGATNPLPALYRGSQGGFDPLPCGYSHGCRRR